MKRTARWLIAALLAAPLAQVTQLPTLLAQETGPVGGPSQASPSPRAKKTVKKAKKQEVHLRPFSRLALGGGISLMGANMQAATNVNRFMNLRGTGNLFNYNVNNITTNGFNVNGKLNFATGGAAVDLYLFPKHGFRVSPGVLFYNQNNVTANLAVASGTKLTLNGQPYYSLASDPILGVGNVALNSQNPAFTMTTGWGNMISRKDTHWSFPFEIGAAFVGAPKIGLNISGTGCTDPADPMTCVNVATDPTVQTNLAQQITKYQKDLDPLKYYPIISFGVAYNFHPNHTPAQ